MSYLRIECKFTVFMFNMIMTGFLMRQKKATSCIYSMVAGLILLMLVLN